MTSREYQRDLVARRRAENREAITAHKEANPCTDCGRFFPARAMVLVPSHGGQAYISMLVNYGRDRLALELSLTTPLCLTCDAVRNG